MPKSADAKRRAQEIAGRLQKAYPDAECALVFHSPLELLIATILSAQCTDVRVNMVTPELFRKYRTARDYAEAPQKQLEREIQSTGFFRNKAKNIKGCCQRLADEHDGQVPQDLDALVKLPGVGRKTANVVLGTAFGKATGVVVDTHVTRISHRLGLTRQTDAVKIEAARVASQAVSSVEVTNETVAKLALHRVYAPIAVSTWRTDTPPALTRVDVIDEVPADLGELAQLDEVRSRLVERVGRRVAEGPH